jgi:hypothetical protein
MSVQSDGSRWNHFKAANPYLKPLLLNSHPERKGTSFADITVKVLEPCSYKKNTKETIRQINPSYMLEARDSVEKKMKM